MELVGPVPNDFVLCTPVGDLILEDIVAPRSISVLIKSDRCPSTTCKCSENNVNKVLVSSPLGLFLSKKERNIKIHCAWQEI